MATSSTESSTSSTLLSRSEDCDSSPDSPLSIRRKRARHIDSNYQSEWSLKYHGIKRSNKGSTYAFCSLCGVDVSIAGGGVHQIKRHCSNKKHSSRSSSQPTIAKAVDTQSNKKKLCDQVFHAELCFARFLTEHNLPFAVADHFNSLVPVMFPDSKIAADFSCARTKTAALITHALAPAADEHAVNALLKQPFTILCNGGNDNFEKKYLCGSGMRTCGKWSPDSLMPQCAILQLVRPFLMH